MGSEQAPSSEQEMLWVEFGVVDQKTDVVEIDADGPLGFQELPFFFGTSVFVGLCHYQHMHVAILLSE